MKEAMLVHPASNESYVSGNVEMVTPVEVVKAKDVEKDYNLNVSKNKKLHQKECQVKDAYNLYTKSELFVALKPLFISLKILSLHHAKDYGPTQDCKQRYECYKRGMAWDRTKSANYPKKRCKVTFSQVYSWVVFVILSFFFLKVFYSYGSITPFDNTMFTTLMSHGWLLVCVLGVLVCLRASHRYEGLPKFFLEWEHLVQELGVKLDIREIRYTCLRCTIMTWIIYAMNFTFLGYLMWGMPGATEILFTPLTLQTEDLLFQIMRILLLLVQVYLLAGWLFVIPLDWVFCKVLYLQFKAFNDTFRQNCIQRCNKTKKLMDQSIGKARLDHQKLVKLVRHVDDFLSLHKASSMGCNILIVIADTYVLINDPTIRLNTFVLVIFLFWLVTGGGLMLIACVSGIMVNEAAHDLHEDLLDEDTRSDPEETHQLQLFLSRLSSGSIGLTVLGLFVVDKSTILTILGALLTYIVVILQLTPGSSSPADAHQCNCTQLLLNSSLTCSLVP